MDIVLGRALSKAALAAALEAYFPGAVVLVVEDMAEIAGQEAQVYAWLVRARGPSSFPLGMGLSSTELGGHADVELMILDLARHLHRTLRCPVLSTSIGAVKLDEDQSLSVLWRGGEALLVSHGSDLDELEPVEAVRVLDWEELGI